MSSKKFESGEGDAKKSTHPNPLEKDMEPLVTAAEIAALYEQAKKRIEEFREILETLRNYVMRVESQPNFDNARLSDEEKEKYDAARGAVQYFEMKVRDFEDSRIQRERYQEGVKKEASVPKPRLNS